MELPAVPEKLTHAAARDYVRQLGGRLLCLPQFGEYVVTFGRAEYYATQLDDAVGTARLMAAEQKESRN